MSFPEAMISCTSRASGVSAFFISRNISPVEIWGMPRRSCKSRACVPFPAPGAPINTMIFAILLTAETPRRRGKKNQIDPSSRLRVSAVQNPKLSPTSTQSRAGSQKAFVITHYKLRFDLRHRVHRDADENEQRRAAEIELISQTGRYP